MLAMDLQGHKSSPRKADHLSLVTGDMEWIAIEYNSKMNLNFYVNMG